MVYICFTCRIEYVVGNDKKEFGNIEFDFCKACQETMWASFRQQFRIGRRTLRLEAGNPGEQHDV